MKSKTKSYIIGIAIPLIVGGLSALLIKDNMSIYESLVQPPLAPPGIVFPTIWPILYVLMGIGSTIIYNSYPADIQDKKQALTIYGIQLFVNFMWSIVFFNAQAYLLSFVVIMILWTLILIMIYRFSKINKTAAWMQVPYVLWVTFAAYLNLAIYILNR